MVSGSISPSLSDCFSPFPHGTGSLSVTRLYLALAGSPAGFPPTFLDPTVLRKDNKKCKLIFTYRAITFYGVSFQKLQLINLTFKLPLLKDVISLQPPYKYGFGLFPLRSPLLRESLLFSFPLATEMFHFARFASLSFRKKIILYNQDWVFPLGDLRVTGCYTPYRSLSQLRHVLHRV